MAEQERFEQVCELANRKHDVTLLPNETVLFAALSGLQLKVAIARSLQGGITSAEAFVIGYDDGFSACAAIRDTREKEKPVKDQNKQTACKTGFFTDHRKNEIRMRLRQEKTLLNTSAESQTEDPSRTKCYQ